MGKLRPRCPGLVGRTDPPRERELPERAQRRDETFLKRANKTYVIFDLVSADGYSQHFEFGLSDLEKEMEREDSPYNAIMTLCEAQGPGFGVSVYERTGIIAEAWRRV